MNNYYVYAHYTLDTNKLFYIGKGKKDRASSKNKRNQYWFKIVNKHGYRIEFLNRNLTEIDAYNLEIKYIEQFQPRCNFTKGGTGGDTFTKLPKKQQEIILNKKRKSMKGKHKGIPKSPSHREKLKCDWRSKPIICRNNNMIYRSIEDCRRQLNLGNLSISQQIKKGYKCRGYTLEFYVKND